MRQLASDHGWAYLHGVYQGKLTEDADFQGNLLKSIICVSISMEYSALFYQRLDAFYASRFADVAESLGNDTRAEAREYARDRLPLSLVVQACSRGIRSEFGQCAFVLLDERYHDYDWRRILEPRPYNLLRTEVVEKTFHARECKATGASWDEALRLAERSNLPAQEGRIK